jgi:hypothetical protein
VQNLGSLGQQIEDMLVAGDHIGGCRRVFGQVAVDGVEELDEFTCSWPGGQDAGLVVAELGQDELQVAFGFVFCDLGEQFGLGAAGPSRVSLGRGDGYLKLSNARPPRPARACERLGSAWWT